MQQSATASPHREDPTRQVVFSAAARDLIAFLCEREGPQVVVLSWPSGAAYLPADCFVATEHDVVLGYTEGCPVYADTRRLALFVNHRILVEADPATAHRPHPPLVVRNTPSRASGRDADPIHQARDDETLTRLSRRVIDELTPRFAGRFAEVMISAYVRMAINDLRGSVSREALPEMAARLAHHRLSATMAPLMPHPIATATRG